MKKEDIQSICGQLNEVVREISIEDKIYIFELLRDCWTELKERRSK